MTIFQPSSMTKTLSFSSSSHLGWVGSTGSSGGGKDATTLLHQLVRMATFQHMNTYSEQCFQHYHDPQQIPTNTNLENGASDRSYLTMHSNRLPVSATGIWNHPYYCSHHYHRHCRLQNSIQHPNYRFFMTTNWNTRITTATTTPLLSSPVSFFPSTLFEISTRSIKKIISSISLLKGPFMMLNSSSYSSPNQTVECQSTLSSSTTRTTNDANGPLSIIGTSLDGDSSSSINHNHDDDNNNVIKKKKKTGQYSRNTGDNLRQPTLKPPAFILACSSNTTSRNDCCCDECLYVTDDAMVVASSTTSLSFLQWILQWIRTWYQNTWNFVLVTIRVSEVVVRFSPLLILAPIAVLSSSYESSNDTIITNITWRYTIHAIQGIGPVAIKFCQWMATRRDIFPPELCNRLSILHDNGYPHSWSYTHRTLQQAFGDDYELHGLSVAPTDIIGCGSAAQVYKGKLRIEQQQEENKNDDDHQHQNKKFEEGSPSVTYREVAIKVLHPNFQEMVDRDLELIEVLADFLHSLPIESIRMLNLPRAVEDFSTVLHNQSDLTIEADNLRQFQTNFYGKRRRRSPSSPQKQQQHQDDDTWGILFPQPIEGWTSSKVLVEDYVHDAVPIADYLSDSSEEGMVIRKELAAPLLRAFLKMVFYDNFIHGDLHPGNVLVTTSLVPASPPSFWDRISSPRTKNSKPTHDNNESSSNSDSSNQNKPEMVTKRSIVFLDAGIAISLSRNDQRNLIDLFRAVIFNNGERAGRLMIERAKYERCSQVDGCVDSFATGIGDIVSEFHDNRKEGLTLGAVRIGGLLSRVLDLCRTHGVEIDPAMASVVISTLVLEGLGRSLSPDLDLLTFAKPFVIGIGRSMTRGSS